MIPKTIHYCWFGKNKKSEEILRCITSWKKHCPEFSIKEWNESSFEIKNHTFTKKMYAEKRWAFVADYVRLHVLEHEGGFYLDTDMLLVQSLSPLCNNTCVLGEEAPGVISAGMIASTAQHPFIVECKKFYETHVDEVITIPRVLTNVFEKYKGSDSLTIFPSKAFYPFDAEHIKNYFGQNLGEDVYGVHLWHYSWGSPLNKFFKKIGIYRHGKRVVEILGVKKILKRLLGFI